MNWQDVQRLRKDGKPDQARSVALEILAIDPGDFRTKGQYQWVIFDYIRRIVAEISESSEKKPVTARDVDRLMARMQEYRDSEPRIPDLSCSAILGQVTRIGEHLPTFPGIVHWVGIEGLRPEDWQPNEFEGKTLPSLATNIARALCKWVKARPDAGKKQMNLALEWVERVKEAAKGDGTVWLNWDMAILLRQMGDSQRAAELLAQVVKAKRNEFWVWAEAGRLYQAEQPELALACFCRALECPAESRFLVRTHRELAELLAEQEEYSQASREAAIALEIRQAEGWAVGRELEALIASPWYDPSAKDAEEPRDFYRRHSDAALALCFDVVETKPATYLGLVAPRKPRDAPTDPKPRPTPRFAILDAKGCVRSLSGPRTRGQKYEVGAPVTVVIGRQDGSDHPTIVHVSARTGGLPWDCTRRVGGKLRRNAKGFAFVDDAFVPSHIVESLAVGVTDVVAHAIWAKDLTKDRYGWRVVQVDPA